MDNTLQDRYDELTNKAGRTGEETAEYIALAIADEYTDRTGCSWSDIDLQTQQDIISTWAEVAHNIITHGTQYLPYQED